MRVTGGRHKVLARTVCVAFITYLDRVCISVTAPAIMGDLSPTPVQMSFIFSSFTIAYALFAAPTGWWGDRVGPRRVLTRIVIWWSLFTMSTASAVGFRSLAAMRFLFGAGETGAWPNVAKALSRWFPSGERGTAQGIFFMGAHLGGGIILVFSLIGLAWAAVWSMWFRDDPADHQSVSAAELRYIQGGATINKEAERSRQSIIHLPSARYSIRA